MTPAASPNSGQWNEYRRLVLSDIANLREDITSVDEKVDQLLGNVSSLRTELKLQQMKSGFIGMVAGAIPGIAAALYILAR